ncbi:hypothetical protein P3L10_014612 [Capsicum annuum]
MNDKTPNTWANGDFYQIFFPKTLTKQQSYVCLFLFYTYKFVLSNTKKQCEKIQECHNKVQVNSRIVDICRHPFWIFGSSLERL